MNRLEPLATVLEALTMPFFSMPIKVRMDKGGTIFVNLKTRDRATGDGLMVTSASMVSPAVMEVSSPHGLAVYLRAAIVRAVEHEIDEHILVAGVRIFDPHERQKMPSLDEMERYIYRVNRV